MDFSSQSLPPGYVVIWSGELEKRQHDRQTKLAPLLSDESRPRMRIRDVRLADADQRNTVAALHEHHIVKAISDEWGIG